MGKPGVGRTLDVGEARPGLPAQETARKTTRSFATRATRSSLRSGRPGMNLVIESILAGPRGMSSGDGRLRRGEERLLARLDLCARMPGAPGKHWRRKPLASAQAGLALCRAWTVGYRASARSAEWRLGPGGEGSAADDDEWEARDLRRRESRVRTRGHHESTEPRNSRAA